MQLFWFYSEALMHVPIGGASADHIQFWDGQYASQLLQKA